MTARATRIATAAAVLLAVAVGLLLYFVGGLSGLELSTLTARFAARDRPRPHNIVVGGVDARTLSTIKQQWPFHRSLDAQAIDILHAAGVREIVYDVQFTQQTTPTDDNAL